ncbi:MAG: GNAT family N-acetyltransferase [Anaerolineales bacterium]|nr:MAG: GNAT family N-acetyltransferase [Anaerolineales bacterium]
MTFSISPYHPSDMPALYRICLLTGDNGKDGSHLYQDPDLIGHYYAAPYAVSEPDLCFLLTHNGMRCGYILGTRNTQAFHQWCEENWFPHLRGRYPLPDIHDDSPDAGMIRLIHREQSVNALDLAYPAHLHIDLLPVAQGQGLGYRMMDTYLNRLRELHVKAVRLGVSRKNPRAIRFYERAGFNIIEASESGIAYGMELYTGT